MPSKLYGLLVGIDDYRAPVPRLAGCLNDIQAIETWLRERVTGEPGPGLFLQVLKNEQATRRAVVDGFRQHLGAAGPDDVVLFYFSGHGSQEQAPEEFWALEPDHLNETLVCYDSRLPGDDCWDLADKELALLIDEVARKAGHVAVVLDCCHSGSGTRDVQLAQTAVRRAPTDFRQRPLASYLVTPAQAARSSATRSAADTGAGWYLAPDGRHVLLAACRDHQEAKEYGGGGQARGAFSYFLTESLSQCGGRTTYRDLFTRVTSSVTAHVNDQSPQLEASGGVSLDALFLDGAVQPAATSYTAAFRQGQWAVNAGRVHGLPADAGRKQVRFALFPPHATADELSRLSEAVARAHAIEIGPAVSMIAIEGAAELPPDAVFKAVVTDVPFPQLRVRLEGDDAAALQSVRQALDSTPATGAKSLFVCEAAAEEPPEFRVLAQNGELLIVRPEDGRPLVDQIAISDPAASGKLVARLEHIARWVQTARLSNPATSLPANAVTVEILRDGQPVNDPVVRLEYGFQEGRWVSPKFQIRWTNRSDRPLFCGLLDLTEAFKISADGLMTSGCVRLEPGQEAWAFGGRAIPATIPDEAWQRGVTEYRDILKWIVCTREFDVRELVQPALDQPRLGDRPGTRGLARNSTLNRLMRRVQTRDLGWEEDAGAAELDDWTASQLTFVTVRPHDGVVLAESGRGIQLMGGVEVKGHARFRARARLLSVPAASRDAGNLSIPPLLRDRADVCAPFALASSRSTAPALSVLELSDVREHTAVTPEEPLTLSVPATLSDQEHILPVGFDGEFYIPLGFARSQSGGSTEVVLQRLPDPTSQGRRSLTGSIRIFFQKVLSEKLGLPYPYPILAAVTDASEAGRVTYDGDADSVRNRVSAARRILVLIHGIIGDTRGMAACTQFAIAGRGLHGTAGRGAPAPVRTADRRSPDPERRSPTRLADLYDLILTFDYENLNTPIPEIARQLKQRLEAAGLTGNHGKPVHLVAHSMGGLVSRWFIEREGGNQIVERLVMLGTPNGGSPWSTLQDWATTALTVGLNAGWLGGAWPVAWLGALVAGIERLDVNLDQMAPGSEFLRDLAASPDPGILYDLVAGNTSLIPAPAAASEAGWWDRLWCKLSLQRTLHAVTAPGFFGRANDIAVSVDSMRHVPSQRVNSLRVREAACDHLSYFSDEAGRGALEDILSSERGRPVCPLPQVV